MQDFPKLRGQYPFLVSNVIRERGNDSFFIGSKLIKSISYRNLMHELLKLSRVPVSVTLASDESFDQFYNQMTLNFKTAVMRRIRGNYSKTLPDFYREIGAALQFPFYFGENADALNDCLQDLAWMPRSATLLMIGRGEEFLSLESEDKFKMIMEVFLRASENHSVQNHSPPLQVLFQYESARAKKRLENLGFAFTEFNLS